MSVDGNPFGDRRNAAELRAMDEETARQTLTVQEYERRERIIETHEQAAEQREAWAEQEREITDIVVHADIEQLGTRVDIFGNDLLVHLDVEDRRVRAVADELETIQDKHDGVDAADAADLSQEDIDELAEPLVELLDLVIRRWNGTAWRSLDDDHRRAILADAREKWSIDGLLVAFAQITDAVEADREEVFGDIDDFR